ncbi:MAG: DUF1854 domain-containing protein [Planctomycetia bacterium]|nr:DUF1854 domain-containing protein [Planctomycetia bacterium]
MQNTFSLHFDGWGRLVLTDADGQPHEGVTAVRAFPLSDRERWISLCDAAGRELACVDDPEQLSPETREVLNEALAKIEFLPAIESIRHVTTGEPSEWQVETDRGPATFILKSDDDIRRLGEHRVLIVDSEGVRYLIPDHTALDDASRRAVDRYL